MSPPSIGKSLSIFVGTIKVHERHGRLKANKRRLKVMLQLVKDMHVVFFSGYSQELQIGGPLSSLLERAPSDLSKDVYRTPRGSIQNDHRLSNDYARPRIRQNRSLWSAGRPNLVQQADTGREKCRRSPKGKAQEWKHGCRNRMSWAPRMRSWCHGALSRRGERWPGRK